ncbi:MAG: hypothetical protein Q8Q14_16185 [Gemmatimonadales bacterium]|nr:hypothetical protein [Gemmatimonadales bacterium]
MEKRFADALREHIGDYAADLARLAVRVQHADADDCDVRALTYCAREAGRNAPVGVAVWGDVVDVIGAAGWALRLTPSEVETWDSTWTPWAPSPRKVWHGAARAAPLAP